MRKLFSIIILSAVAMHAAAQGNAVQNRPYTDLRPFHFGVVVGTHFQDIEFGNIGPQTVMNEDGTQGETLITCDQDRWDMGFNVGVLGELRLSQHFAFRMAPTLYFGNRHLTLYNHTDRLENGEPLWWGNMPSTSTYLNWYPVMNMYVTQLREYFEVNDVYPDGDTSVPPIKLP